MIKKTNHQKFSMAVQFFTGSQVNITFVDDGITYSCGPTKETRLNNKTIQYEKVYKCCMVDN